MAETTHPTPACACTGPQHPAHQLEIAQELLAFLETWCFASHAAIDADALYGVGRLVHEIQRHLRIAQQSGL
jgi:hypothetical protein